MTECFKVVFIENFGKSTASNTALLVKIQAIVNNLNNLIFGVYTGKLFGQLRMTAQLSSQLNTKASTARLQRAARANRCAPAASHTSLIIDLRRRLILFQGNGVFLTCVYTSGALSAFRFAGFRNRCADDADVFDLRL